MDWQTFERTAPTVDIVGRALWAVQHPKFREPPYNPETSVRMVAISIECAEVTIEQWHQLICRIYVLRPVPRFFSQLMAAAAKNPILAAPQPACGDQLPWTDDMKMKHLAEQNCCECLGSGIVVRRVPNRLYRRGESRAYCCRCPIGRALLLRSEISPVERWEDDYGPQRSLFARSVTTERAAVAGQLMQQVGHQSRSSRRDRGG